jgi:hypothetical protein
MREVEVATKRGHVAPHARKAVANRAARENGEKHGKPAGVCEINKGILVLSG